MPAWLSLALTLFYIAWLFAVLMVLWFVWRKQVNRLATLEQALIKSAQMSAEAAKTSAETARLLTAQKDVEET